jgi:hypothetical protein
MNYGRLVMAVLALMAAAPAAAQDAKFRNMYLGASMGLSMYHDFCDNAAVNSTTPVTSCEEKPNAYRGFVGYRFNRNLALEVGYAGLGQATALANVGGPLLPVRMKAKGWDYSAVLSFPFSDSLYGYGRLGAYTMRVWTDTFVANAPTVTTAETNTGFTTGLGLGYDLGILGLRADWQRYLNIGGGSVAEDTVDTLTLGVLFRF